MKKFVLLFCLLFIFVVSPVKAQTTFEVLKDDYLREFDEYVAARDIYLEDRAEYIKYQSLVARSEAIKTTQEFLRQRQDVLVSYLIMMKERLEQSENLTDDELRGFISYINTEIDFLNEKRPLFDSANNLNDLVGLSDQIERRYNEFIVNALKMKALIVLSKVRSLRITEEDLINLTEEQVARIRKEGILETTDMDRWLVDAPERLLFSANKEAEAWGEMSKASARGGWGGANRAYGRFLSNIRTSAQYLREANGLLLQIIKAIRFQ